MKGRVATILSLFAISVNQHHASFHLSTKVPIHGNMLKKYDKWPQIYSVGEAQAESKGGVGKGKKKTNSFDQFLRLQTLFFFYKIHILRFLELSSTLTTKVSMIIYGAIERKRGESLLLFQKAGEISKKRRGRD